MPVYGLTTFGYNDVSRERSTMTVHAIAIDAGNEGVQSGLRDDLHTATSALSLGIEVSEQWGNRDQIAGNSSMSASGHRELKIDFTIEDNVTFKTYHVEIPVADGDAFIIAGSDDIDMANATVIAWVDAAEAYVVSPYPAGNPISVLSGKVVGRNT